MTIMDAVDNLIAQYGSPHTLRKDAKGAGANNWTAGAPTVTYNACRAKSRGYKLEEIRAGIQESDYLVTVSASSLPGGVVPQRGDRLAIGIHTTDGTGLWVHVVAVHATNVAGATLSYRLQVRQ